ncbi:MAG: BrnA antitoxin family protein [Betaproteobacteria bacterium]|nr:MAG: BrnA antitoxin family protein [Betaproteobacteria bacterium]
MAKRKPLTDKAGNVRELTQADFRAAVPVAALPAALRKKLRGRGPQKAPTKARITIRLSHDVVDRFRATGDGWQTRVDAALKDWLKRHSPA